MVWGENAYVTFRGPGENPRDPRCALHLQRICGNCTHYQGALKPAEGEPRTAPCAYFQIQKHAQAHAWGCRRFERRTEGGAE